MAETDKEFSLGMRVQKILMKAGYVRKAKTEGKVLFDWGRLEEDLLSGKFDPLRLKNVGRITAAHIAETVNLEIARKTSMVCPTCSGHGIIELSRYQRRGRNRHDDFLDRVLR